jgi:hypothetical protein
MIKRKPYIIALVLLFSLLFIVNLRSVTAFDEDNDGINDEYEQINLRNIETEIFIDEIKIESFKRTEANKDQITINIGYSEDGLHFGLLYRSKIDTAPVLSFGILLHEVIEFIDNNENNIFDPETDQILKNVSLNDFHLQTNASYELSSGNALHYFKLQDVNNTFIAHIHFAEEFAIINDSIITPTQIKVDIEFLNFEFSNESSMIAINTRLESEVNYIQNEETEDERNKFSSNEHGLITTNDNYIGFLTWNENATIDTISNKIYTSELMVDDLSENEQKMYFTYLQGNTIYHSFKLGFEGLLKSIPSAFSPGDLTLLFIIVGAVSASAIALTYYFIQDKPSRRKTGKKREEYYNSHFEEHENNEPYNEEPPIQIILEEKAMEKLLQIKNLNVTVVSEEFYEIINSFPWENNEKYEFIREMLSLTPLERKSFLNEMKELLYQE